MRKLFLAAVLSIGLGTGACTTLQSAYLTNLSRPLDQGRPIEAETTKVVFLGLNFSNEYAFEVRKQLFDACPNGMVTGILSTYETTWYFIVTSHTVKARGYCISPTVDAKERT